MVMIHGCRRTREFRFESRGCGPRSNAPRSARSRTPTPTLQAPRCGQLWHTGLMPRIRALDCGELPLETRKFRVLFEHEWTSANANLVSCFRRVFSSGRSAHLAVGHRHDPHRAGHSFCTVLCDEKGLRPPARIARPRGASTMNGVELAFYASITREECARVTAHGGQPDASIVIFDHFFVAPRMTVVSDFPDSRRSQLTDERRISCRVFRRMPVF